MTPVKWYLLYVTGSLNRDKTFVPRYTEESERRGHVPKSCSWGKKHKPRISSSASTLNKPQEAKKKSKRRSTGKKLPKTNKGTKTDPVNPCLEKGTKSPCIPDSPQMLEFFAEVRQRHLKDYYLRMKAAERCSKAPAISPPSRNIYCSGAKSIRQELQNITKGKVGNWYGDTIWLWSSSIARPNSALNSRYCRGGCSKGM